MTRSDQWLTDESELLGHEPRTSHRAPSTFFRPDILTIRRRPVWIVAGQVGLVLIVVLGFQALQPFKKDVFALLLVGCVATMAALGPVGRARQIIVTVPVAAIVVWWLTTGLWAFNVAGWRVTTTSWLPLVFAPIAIVGMLPIKDIFRGLVAGCQVAMIWTVLFTVTHLGTATRHGDGTPGWTGSFVHKNSLAPFMLFAVLVAWSFEDNRTRRRLMYAVAAVFIVMSQSTTVLAISLIIIPLGMLIRYLSRLTIAGRSALLLVSIVGCIAFGVALMSAAESLLASRGKDLTFSSRTEIWAGVIDAIQERPLLGYGAGGVWLNPTIEPTRSILAPLGFTAGHAHNGYLEVLLQFGAIGLVLVVLVMVLVFRTGVLELQRDENTGVFMMLFVLLVALTSLSEVTLLGPWLALLCVLQTVGARLRRIPSEAKLSPASYARRSDVLDGLRRVHRGT